MKLSLSFAILIPLVKVYSIEDTIFTLQYSRVHVSILNGCDIPSNIKAMIDKTFSSTTTLYISDIELDNRHIRFG